MWQNPSPQHRRRRRHRLLCLAGLTTAALLSLAFNQWGRETPMVVYNASASVPKGFYRVSAVKGLHRGDLVLMATPDSVRILADQRRYLPKSVPMIKTVAALSGDEICAVGVTILINGHSIAIRQSYDRQGRPMPQWHGCRTLKPGEFLPLNPATPHSFDGRYFGAVPTALVRGQLEPL